MQICKYIQVSKNNWTNVCTAKIQSEWTGSRGYFAVWIFYGSFIFNIELKVGCLSRDYTDAQINGIYLHVYMYALNHVHAHAHTHTCTYAYTHTFIKV